MNAREDVVANLGGIEKPWVTHPALWLSGHRVRFPTLPGWTLQTATGINDRGQICGTGLHEGKTRAYVLTPKG